MDDRLARILLVEDDEDDYILAREALSEIPGVRFELEWAATSEAALERMGRGEFDAVLVDYRLGESSGMDLIRQATARRFPAPMILLTGQGDREVDIEAMQAGAADYLVKSQINAAVLERAIRYAIERARGEAALRRAYRELSEANERLTCEVAERARAEAELARLAFYDPLTGLPNRALFRDRLEHALARAGRYHRPVAVLFLDLDNFKVVNDSLGHEFGDRLLVDIAERLRTSVRTGDTVARLGGDEFTVLLEDVAGEAEALAMVERIAEQLRLPVEIHGRQIFTGASIGLALGLQDRDRPEDLLRKADLAMYRAKANGKGCCEVFDPSMNADALERLELESDLHGAVERGEFRLLYQPILSLQSGRIGELEALVRWEHPRRGQIPPATFIPIAEETGLIVPLGRWVLEEACRRTRAWQAEFPARPPLNISVNLSVKQFRDPRLVADIERVLRETGLDPSCLQLEITESAIMVDTDAAVATLDVLKRIGVRLAIDDFGTGYSSLSYLKHLPVDTLKIDRSFVSGLGQDPNDGAIVQGVIALARTLNLETTGEGIETPEQLSQLQALGCDRGQGYYFARPLPPEMLQRLLAGDASADSERPNSFANSAA